MTAVRVKVPKHDGCSYQGTKTTTGKKHFKCPECGKKFSIKEHIVSEDVKKMKTKTKEKKPTPECIHSNGCYICSLSEKELTFDRIRGEVICDNQDCKCSCAYGQGIVFDEIIQSAYTHGIKNDDGLVNQGYQKEKGKAAKKQNVPFKLLKTLGLKGINIEENPIVLRGSIEDRVTFDFEGKTRVPIKIGENLYDIGHERFVLFHKYECLKEYKENDTVKYVIDKEPSHVSALIDKHTKHMYVMPAHGAKIFDFTFEAGTLYRYFPQKGNDLTDGDAFRDNSKFLAYKTKEILPNPKTNKREKIFGYLVKEDDVDKFLSLIKRPTRIFANDDYSGIPKYQKETLWTLKNKKTYKNVLEVIVDEYILEKFLDLVDDVPELNVDITEFGDVDLDEIKLDKESFEDIDWSDSYINKLKDEEVDFSKVDIEHIMYQSDAWTDEEYEDIIDKYEDVRIFIDEYCEKFFGNTEEVLRKINADATEDDNEKFTRFIEEFDGGKENKEYFAYSNYDLIQACKTQHDFKLVLINGEENQAAIKELYAIGDISDPSHMYRAQEVAFGHEAEYASLKQIIKENEQTIKTVKVFDDKPREEWSEQDYERFIRGEDVKEIKSIVIGAKASKKDPITKHLLYDVPLPEDLKCISISGSRVLPIGLRTKQDDYGDYYTPAVTVWKGYYIKNQIRTVFARVAKGSDCAGIIAAIEINEYLANRIKKGNSDFDKGEITKEELDQLIQEYEDNHITIVCVLHNYYGSADYNNLGLTAIFEQVLHYQGYIYGNEPYRTKREAEQVTSPVSWFNERSNKLEVIQSIDETGKVSTRTNQKFHWFNRQLERANKRLVQLGGKENPLVILCRSQYSGTTNTMNFALDMGKEVIEITSPTREIPKRLRHLGATDKESYEMYQRFKRLSENDPIQKGHSDSKRPNIKVTEPYHDPANIRCKPKNSNVKEYKEHKNYIVATVPSVINDYAKWYKTIESMKSGFMWVGLVSKTYGSIVKHINPKEQKSLVKKTQEVSSQKKDRVKLTQEDLIKIYPHFKEMYESWGNTDSRTWTKSKRPA